MPEVVEVCLTAQWLHHELSESTLLSFKVIGGRYSRHVLTGLSIMEKKSFKVKKVDSKGKFMWFELEREEKNYYILNRFGLTGFWGFEKQENSGIEMTFKDKKLYFTDDRNFGTIEITSDVSDLHDELNNLNDDLLKTNFDEKDFYEKIKSYISISKARERHEIIKVLMNQTVSGSIGSGLGNYLAVEILYDAKISPYTKIKAIYDDKKLSDKLCQSIKYVTKLSYATATTGYFDHLDKGMAKFIEMIRKNKTYDYHPDIKLNENDKFAFNVYRKKYDPEGNKINKSKIVNKRTTYWSPLQT